jgi:hypothetical protein
MQEALKEHTAEIVAVIQAELRTVVSTLRGELGTAVSTLRGELGTAVSTLRDELGTAVSTLRGEIGTAFSMCEEHIGLQIDRRAIQTEENVVTRVGVMLDPFKGLPERVSRLEAKVFAPKRRATAARRKRS